jgi:predicted phage-related endonuclease
LEVIAETGKIKPVLQLLSDDKDKITDIISLASKVANEVKKIPPSIEPREVKDRLTTLQNLSMNWHNLESDNNDDIALRRGLEDLVEELKRLRKLKKGGVEAYKDQPSIYEPLKSVIDKCALLGEWHCQVQPTVPTTYPICR